MLETLSNQFNLSDEERKALLQRDSTGDNRIGWARTYLTKAGLLETPKEDISKLLQLESTYCHKPSRDQCRILMQYDTFQEFRFGKSPQTENKGLQ